MASLSLSYDQKEEIRTRSERSTLLDTFIDQIYSLLHEQKKGNKLSNISKEILNTSIIVDLHIDHYLKYGKKKMSHHLNVLSGLPPGLHIKNYEALIHFCQIHGFFPLINKIYLGEEEITNKDLIKINDLQQLNALFIYLVGQNQFSIPIFSEISKIFNDIDTILTSDYEPNDLIEITNIVQELAKVRQYHDYTFGARSQRNSVGGTLSEKLAIEVASRLENEVREKLGMPTTYMKLASYAEDVNEKTDLTWTIYDGIEYRNIPVQLTIAGKTGALPDKIRSVENFLMKNKHNISYPFYFSVIHGPFKEKIASGLTQIYTQWKKDKSMREMGSPSNGFPYFIDIIEPQYSVSAKTNYIMLHIIQHIIQTNDLVGGLSRMPTSNAIKNLETTIKNEIQKLIEEKSKIKIDLVKIQNINIDHINVTILSTQDANTQNKAKIICKVSLSYSYRKTHHGNIIVYI